MGVGASMLGVRPVMELMFWSFASVAWDQIVNNAGCVRYMCGGLINCPIVIRGPANGGTNVGATHSHTPENMLANIPGAESRLPRHRLRCQGPDEDRHPRQRPRHVHGEHPALRRDSGKCPEEEYLIPLGVADVKREGTDISLIAHGRAVLTASRPPRCSRREHDINAEVLDLRSIRPLDEEAILAIRRAKPIAPCSSRKTSPSAASARRSPP